MACSKHNDAGFATPAALIVCLAIAVIAAGLLGRSAAELRAADADMMRQRLQTGLDGAHLQAAAAIITTGQAGPYHWTFQNDVGWVEAVAEPEYEKLTLEAVQTMPDAAFSAFGIASAVALKERLAEAREQPRDVAIAELDSAPAWRDCAPSMVSPYGDKTEWVAKPYVEPGPGPYPASWHVGEVWRVRVETADGWRDDRLVRFTGDAQHPAATITRWWGRSSRKDLRCETILSGL